MSEFAIRAYVANDGYFLSWQSEGRSIGLNKNVGCARRFSSAMSADAALKRIPRLADIAEAVEIHRPYIGIALFNAPDELILDWERPSGPVLSRMSLPVRNRAANEA